MKWDTIKDRCVSEAHKDLGVNSSAHRYGLLLAQLIKEGNGMGFYDAQKSARIACFEAIDRWDIRMWKSLKRVFPKAFPDGLSQPELTENGWELL